MKTRHQLHKLITLFMPTMIWVYTSLTTVFAEEELTVQNTTTILPSALNPANVRMRLQIDYALKVAQETVNAFNAFKQKYNRTMSEDELKWFKEELLLYGKDLIVQAIDYTPKDNKFVITLQNNDFVEPQLQGIRFTYTHHAKTEQWKFNPGYSTITTIPPPPIEEVDHAMWAICQYIADPEWCIWEPWNPWDFWY